MCSICGLIDFHNKHNINKELLIDMGKSMKHRGVDDDGHYLFKCGGFQHNRLSVIDPENGKQPFSINYQGKLYTIIYNGEIYNCDELKRELIKNGVTFSTNCDTEVVLYAYIIFKEQCVEKLNGIFAFAVYDDFNNHVYFARDRFGVKPFFYSMADSTFVFASEIKAILKHPSVSPVIDKTGLWQLLFLAPMTMEGYTVFKDIKELKPAHYGIINSDGIRINKYWQVEPKEVKITSEEAAEKLEQLMYDAVKRQLVSDVPLCTFLSGGLDSSVITAIASREYTKRGRVLSTYSFEYEGNKQNFQKSLFLPQGDDEFAVYTADYLGTDHTILTVPTKTVADYLEPAMMFRDFPGQADIDSSLLYFCEQVKKNHTVAMSGECSDEIFGGYPWFYREEMLYSDFFPFIHDPFARINMFDKSKVSADEGYDFMSKLYKKDINSVKVLDSDNDAMKTSRIATYLSVKYFMSHLLERKDRMSMASSLEVRVPFADHRIIEFVYNIPWEIKFENHVEKALLRNSMKKYLPEKILWRKKNPYPKTHNPEYERIVSQMLSDRIKKGSPIADMLNYDVYKSLQNSDNVTWFGQLMGKPQLLAWLLQFDSFMQKYNCIFE